MRTVVLVDGEHYPPVTRWGIETAMHRGHDVVGALFMGGIEKIDPGRLPDVGVPSRAAGEDRMAGLAAAIDTWAPEVVLDLSDEPVLGYRERMELAAVALTEGLRYVGADFEIVPPIDGPPITAPTLAVIGTGKRTGKTAISGEVARLASRRGRSRDRRHGSGRTQRAAGGRGRHRAPRASRPAGARRQPRCLGLPGGCAHDRCDDDRGTARRGGGRGGAVRDERPGCGRACRGALTRGRGARGKRGGRPPCPGTPASWWCRPVLLPSTWVATSGLTGCCGPTWSLLPWLPARSPGGNLSALRSHVLRFLDASQLLVTDFVPVPLADVQGARVFFATTAPGGVAARAGRPPAGGTPVRGGRVERTVGRSGRSRGGPR